MYVCIYIYIYTTTRAERGLRPERLLPRKTDSIHPNKHIRV